MKIVAITVAHNRFKVWDKFLSHFKALSGTFIDSLVFAHTSRESLTAAKRAGVSAHPFPVIHNIVSDNFRAALSKARELSPDYVFITGMDNLYSPEVVEEYKRGIEAGAHYLGCLDFYLLDYPDGRGKYFPGFKADKAGVPLGAGRMFHKNLLDLLKWELWPAGLSHGLDDSTNKRLWGLNYETHFFKSKDLGGFVVDLKTSENIWTYKNWYGNPLTTQELKELKEYVSLH